MAWVAAQLAEPEAAVTARVDRAVAAEVKAGQPMAMVQLAEPMATAA